MDDAIAISRPHLRLLAYPSGAPVDLYGADVLVGRNVDADLRLPMPDVSRRHCRFRYERGHWRVIDLSSVNGTWVNEERIDEADLNPGDFVRVAGFTFEVPIAKREPVELTMPRQIETPLRKAS